MATLRYLAGFYSDQGTEWDIYIDDNSTNFVVLDAITAVDGFTLTYPKQTKDSPRQAVIIPSDISFGFQNQNAANDTFQADVVSANEERFKIKILKDGVLFWVGFVLTDRVEIYDEAKPHTFQIAATDGIGRLKDIDYNNAGTAYSGRATILEHIFNCLNKVPLSYFHGSGDIFLRVICNWYEDQHTVVSTLDPLTVTDFDHSVFITTASDGTKTYANCYDVLKECLQLFGARLYQSDGYWVIEQINERENATITLFNYDLDAVHVSTSTTSYEAAINTTSNSVRPRRVKGGRFPFYQPLDKVCNTYKHNGSTNLLIGSTFEYNANVVFPPTDEITLGNLDISGTGDETLRISGKINFTSTWIQVNNLINYRHVFRIKCKVGTQYLKRPIVMQAQNVAYGPMEWTTVESYYEISTSPLYQYGTTPNETQINSFLNIYFETPSIILGGDIDFNIYWYECRNATTDTLVTNTLPGTTVALSYYVVDQSANLMQDGTQYNMETSRKYCVENGDSDKNTSSIKLESIVGDGPYNVTFNKLKVYDGADWQVSNDWRVDDTGTAYQIQELLIRQILAGQKIPIKRYEGSIIGDISPLYRLNWDSEYYLFEGGSFNANEEVWTASWFNITTDPTGITTITSVPESEVILVEVGGLPIEVSPGTGPQNPVATGGVVVQTGGATSGPLTGGFIGNLPVDPLNILFQIGDILNIMDPQTGVTDIVTVTAPNALGATSLAVEGYINNDYPSGVSIIPDATQAAEENQLSGEVIATFFEDGAAIEDTNYFLKTTIQTPSNYIFQPVPATTNLTVAVTEFFWTIPPALDGSEIRGIFTAFATAGGTGNTTIDYKVNGASAFYTATIAGGSTTDSTTLSTPQALSTGDVITVDDTAISSPAPKGLEFNFNIYQQKEILLQKIKYDLYRTETENLLLWNQMNYIPQVPIGFGGLTFDSGSALDCGNDSSTALTTALSLSIWVKFDDLTPVAGIIGRYGTLQGYAIVNYGSFIALVFDTQTTCSFSTTALTDRTWYHLAATWDGTTATIYLDGVEMDTATYTTPTTAATFYIGTLTSGANYLDGSVTGARLWNRAITHFEVLSTSRSKYNELTASEKIGLVSAWEISDYYDSVAPDSHGDNDGTPI